MKKQNLYAEFNRHNRTFHVSKSCRAAGMLSV